MTSHWLAGLWRHFVLALRLNLRNRQALIYGYVVPVLFLLAFGAVFRGETPPLRNQLGQLLTITILGGACFGLPTTLVADRERGVWRRYQLLPVSPRLLAVATLAARLVVVASSALMQLALARLAYGTPWPADMAGFIGAFLVVTLAFLGWGLLVAAVAADVPAVQAIGQCLFLPMILIGGVGVPLATLPMWARQVAAFMPGRYAVDVLQRAVAGTGWSGVGFSVLALAAIGAAAGGAGAALFRWEQGRATSRREWTGLGVALLVWVAIGATAVTSGRSRELGPATVDTITDEQVAAIRFDDLPGDNELATRLAPPFASVPAPARVQAIAASLRSWPAAQTDDPLENVRHLLAVAAIADIGADLNEAEIARAVWDQLQAQYRHAELRRLLAAVVLIPEGGTVVPTAPELDLRRAKPNERLIRERSVLYAKKFLGRLTGAITAP